METLFEIRAEETHLHGAGLLYVPSVLVARARAMLSAAPVFSRSSAPSLPRSCPLLLVVVRIALILIVATATRMVTPSLIAS